MNVQNWMCKDILYTHFKPDCVCTDLEYTIADPCTHSQVDEFSQQGLEHGLYLTSKSSSFEVWTLCTCARVLGLSPLEKGVSKTIRCTRVRSHQVWTLTLPKHKSGLHYFCLNTFKYARKRICGQLQKWNTYFKFGRRKYPWSSKLHHSRRAGDRISHYTSV